MHTTTRSNWARRFVFAAGLAAVLTGAVAAQQRGDNGDDWCRDENRGRTRDDRQSVCEVREYTVPAVGATLTVDAAPNGGISVQGSARGDILVQAKVVATAATEEEARALAGRVQVVATADRVSADGPRGDRSEGGWSVSYRLAVPTQTPLALKSTNGGISIDNLNSRIEFRTINGGVKLSHIGGDVEGKTSNGGVTVDLDGSTWQGAGLDVETTNGGVQMAIPERYSAHLETGTNNGSLRIDFPVLVQGTIGRSFSSDIGGGGPTLRVSTSNGGVRVTRK
jgi:putative adhesin